MSAVLLPRLTRTEQAVPAALLAALRADLVTEPGTVDVPRVSRLLRAQDQVVGAAELLRITTRLREHIDGLGPLQDLAIEGVTDILVNADGSVWVDDGSGLHRTPVEISAGDARALAVRLATATGRRLDDACPCADAHLADGTRLHAVLPPLSSGGTLISLRLPARRRFTLAALERSGALSETGRVLLEAVVAARVAFIVSGGTGTGKTTLLGAMLSTADPAERIVIVEDARELDPDHVHAVHLQARHENTEGAGVVDLTALVRQCLRMRPDRIVVGECRGAEVRELLQALNTGHEGGCGTVHANTAADVPARLEALGALGGLDRQALATQAVSALDVIIHLGRRGGQRTVDQLALLERDASGHLVAVPAADLRGGSVRAETGWPMLAARLGVPETLAARAVTASAVTASAATNSAAMDGATAASAAGRRGVAMQDPRGPRAGGAR